jgi:hypothetical protein
MIPDKEDELINEMVQEVFMQYDTNDSTMGVTRAVL